MLQNCYKVVTKKISRRIEGFFSSLIDKENKAL